MNYKVSKETIIRTVVLIISLVNNVLTMTGKNPLPFAENDIYTGVSCAVTVAATLWAWWKNNSFTQEALAGDALMNRLREEGDHHGYD